LYVLSFDLRFLSAVSVSIFRSFLDAARQKNGAERPSAKIPSKLTYPLGFIVYFDLNVRKWRERVVTVRAHSACADATTPSRIPPGRHAARRTVAIDVDWISGGVSEP
jgi:hypothetical protein